MKCWKCADGRWFLSKVTATGKVRDWVFDPYWVRVRLEKVASILDSGDLFLSSHGQKLLWAGFLPLPSAALWQPRWSTHCRVSGPAASDFTCQNSHSFRLLACCPKSASVGQQKNCKKEALNDPSRNLRVAASL